MKTSRRLESPCRTQSGLDCSVSTIAAKRRGITTNDPSSGDMTIIDFPTQLAFDPPSRGKLGLNQEIVCLGFCDVFGPGSEISPCTQHELLALRVEDPTGAPFATLGSSTR